MSEAAPLVPPGTVLDGKYIVERTLGEGGMGVVVAARHTVLGTRVAIKVLHPGAMVESDTVERFHREARSAVRIHSPHAARVHDVGTLSDGAPYMVMDLLTGKDLSALLSARGALSPQETISFVVQALEAIGEAHALGIIHRDLKPANLFLADQASRPPIVKVLDFGIARDFHEGNEQRLTRTHTVMGSPAYMSPEQMREARSADARSDIWSIGVCLYELVTGVPPFVANSIPDLYVTILHGTPVAPSAMRGDLPPGLSDTILRCLEKDPARRFQSAIELATALQTGVSGATWSDATTNAHPRTPLRLAAPGVAPPLPSTERLATSHTLSKPGKPPRLNVFWLGVVAVGMMGVALVAGSLWRRPSAVTSPVHAQPGPSTPPTDLPSAGAVSTPLAPPATSSGSAAVPSASASARPSPPMSAPKILASPPGRPPRAVPVASPHVAEPRPLAVIPAPPPAPTFDPGQAF